jgi:phosphoserine phosphatase
MTLKDAHTFRLVTLDFDGTLFRANSALFLEQKGLLGQEIRKLHSRYNVGEINEIELNRLQFPLLNQSNLTLMLQALADGPLLENIQAGVNSLKFSGLSVAMLTFNPLQIFFERQYGVDTSISMNTEIKDDRISSMRQLPDNKFEYLKRYCASNSIELKDVVHVGDGLNDLRTFKAVGFSIALNSKYEEVKRNTDLSLETNDFLVVAQEILGKIPANNGNHSLKEMKRTSEEAS